MVVFYIFLLKAFWGVALPYNTSCSLYVRVSNAGNCLFLKAYSAFSLSLSGESGPGTKCRVLASCQRNCGEALPGLRCKEAEQVPLPKYFLHHPVNRTTNVSAQPRIHRPCPCIPALKVLGTQFTNSS